MADTVVLKGAAPNEPALAPKSDLNINKLAQCVAVAETSNCTTGMGVTRKNCHGIMTWKRGFREGRTFNSTEESFIAFKELWLRVYKVYPNLALAKKYTGNDNAQRWLNIVNQCYYE